MGNIYICIIIYLCIYVIYYTVYNVWFCLNMLEFPFFWHSWWGKWHSTPRIDHVSFRTPWPMADGLLLDQSVGIPNLIYHVANAQVVVLWRGVVKDDWCWMISPWSFANILNRTGDIFLGQLHNGGHIIITRRKDVVCWVPQTSHGSHIWGTSQTGFIHDPRFSHGSHDPMDRYFGAIWESTGKGTRFSSPGLQVQMLNWGVTKTASTMKYPWRSYMYYVLRLQST